jgi:hypothetical protein
MSKKVKDKIKDVVVKEEEEKDYTNPDNNLLGVFGILLEVALRTNPEKYLVGYKKKYD